MRKRKVASSNDVLVFPELLRRELDALVAARPGAKVASIQPSGPPGCCAGRWSSSGRYPRCARPRASYRALLPRLEGLLAPGWSERLAAALDETDQAAVEQALVDVLAPLLTSTDADAGRLAGELLAVHAPNAVGNFCFDVMLSYRRLERPRRRAAEAE